MRRLAWATTCLVLSSSCMAARCFRLDCSKAIAMIPRGRSEYDKIYFRYHFRLILKFRPYPVNVVLITL